MIKKLADREGIPEASWTIDSCPKCGGDLEEFINMCGMELGCPRCKWNTLEDSDSQDFINDFRRASNEQPTPFVLCQGPAGRRRKDKSMRYEPYRAGKQPCDRFNPGPCEQEEFAFRVHQCPLCGGLRMFCRNCYFDHHENGWETCDTAEKERTMIAAIEKVMKVIEEAIRTYECNYGEDNEAGSGMLVDVLSPPGDTTIERGKKELELLIDHVQGAVFDLELREKYGRKKGGER